MMKKEIFFIFNFSNCLNCIIDMTFNDKTGKTQGMKFNIIPPTKANIKNLIIFSFTVRLLKFKRTLSTFFPSEIEISTGFFKFFRDSSDSK